MRHALLLTMVIIATTLSAGIARAQDFLSAVEDLPVMEGLTEHTELGLVFDTAGGRIVEAYAGGELAPEAIRAFYRLSLSQLGWMPEDGQGIRFVRDGETLDIDFPDTGSYDGTLVRFRIAPKPDADVPDQ